MRTVSGPEKAGHSAVIFVAEFVTPGSGVPFNKTTEPDTKFVPVIVIAVALPTPTVCGDIAAIVGAGTTVSTTRPDAPPPGPGVVTVRVAVPEGRGATHVAVRLLPETNVVARFAPFSATTEFDVNPVPVTVNVPLAAEDDNTDGRTDATAGAGFTI
jgi:predicted dinucleotide-binding enzyme